MLCSEQSVGRVSIKGVCIGAFSLALLARNGNAGVSIGF
jgi:hypothetical protein